MVCHLRFERRLFRPQTERATRLRQWQINYLFKLELAVRFGLTMCFFATGLQIRALRPLGERQHKNDEKTKTSVYSGIEPDFFHYK